MFFSNRGEELQKVKEILSLPISNKSVYFEVFGKSGAGKTEIIKKAVSELVMSDPNCFVLYIDITPDEYQSTAFFSSLIETSYLPFTHHYNTITNVPKRLSLSRYIKRIVKKYRGFEKTLDVLTLSSSVIPYVGDSISAILGKVQPDDFYTIENLFFVYLKKISKKKRINIIIDNYQFLPYTIRRCFETYLNSFSSGTTLLIINRIEDNRADFERFCENFIYKSLEVRYISYSEYKMLIENQKIYIEEDKVNRLWAITKGNLKDIDIILNEIRINPGYDILESNIAINSLDSIQRSILLITALFPAGMKEKYIVNFIHDILNETQDKNIKSAISNLVTLGYIYINSMTHDTIKPTHETVIKHVKEGLDTYNLTVFCEKLSSSLESTAMNLHGTKDYAYLLHCWIGINNSKELKSKTSFIQDLINIRYKENAYYYIDTIANSLKEVVCYLPNDCIEKILVSIQRVSDFSVGIDILNTLRVNAENIYNQFIIYNIKFLIQTYNFEDALNNLKQIQDSSEKLLCQTNALQHLGRDKEVYALLNSKLQLCDHDENYYIILRNTAHFFSFEEAENNLRKAYSYFSERNYTEFVLATINNNLAVINIWAGNYSVAQNLLNSAIDKLSKLYSNEIFEPYCNQSVMHFLLKEFDKAKISAENALRNCPKLLTLDIIMLKVNLAIIRYALKELNVSELYDILNDIKGQYPIIDDPWYEFQLLYNLKSTAQQLDKAYKPLEQKHLRYVYEYNNNLTKFYIMIDLGNNSNLNMCLGLSPNWRY